MPEGSDEDGRLSLAALSKRVEAATPSYRDRYLDFLRVSAILVVIFGHWMVRVFTAPGGEPEVSYLLSVQPGWQWATLLFQVMPLIFLVGGALNAESWRRARGDGVPPVQWIRRRALSLLKPTTGFVLIVVPGSRRSNRVLQQVALQPGRVLRSAVGVEHAAR